MRQALAERLWAGPLDDPAAPGRALVTATDYARVLPDARALVAWRLPLDLPSLQQRWPWSIDLALLSVEAEGDIAPLRRAVETQGRRHGVLARALWSLGRDTEAIAVLGVFTWWSRRQGSVGRAAGAGGGR